MIEVEGMTYFMGQGFLAGEHLGGQHDDAILMLGCSGEIGEACDKRAEGIAINAIDLVNDPDIVILGRVPSAKVFENGIHDPEGSLLLLDTSGSIGGEAGCVYPVDAVGRVAVRVPLGHCELDLEVPGSPREGWP